jgi:tetratricopeptide (TPR) repeat protein
LSPALFNNRGICHFHIEQFQKALEDYNKAIHLDSSFGLAYFNKGNCLGAIVRYEEALLSYDKALKWDSGNQKVYVNRAQILFYMQDYQSAINDYSKAIRLKSTYDKTLYLSRGNAYYMIREYEMAIADYDSALGIDPEYYKAYINRGICKLDMGKTEEAIRDFTLSIRFNEMDGESYYYRALANIRRMQELSKKFNGSNEAQIYEFRVYNQLACSDISKAIKFGYSKAYELESEFCSK